MAVVGQTLSFGTIGVNLLYDEAERYQRYHEAFALRGGLKLEKLVGCQARKFTVASIRFIPSTSCHPYRYHHKPLIFF